MDKRDLKADLEWMLNAPSDHAKELEIAVHALERAIEAESLARELVEALEHFETVGIDDALKDRIKDAEKVQAVLAKAKEVLENAK